MVKEHSPNTVASIKIIYDRSVKLLELLSVLIPKMDNVRAQLPVGLAGEVSDLALELGTELLMIENDLEDAPPIDDSLNPLTL